MRKLMSYLIAVICFFPSITMAASTPEFIQQSIPDAKPAGQARMTYMFWDVYDATLYASQGAWEEGKPLALTLHYLREIKGDDIADRSVEEMRGIGMNDEVKLAAWYSQMREIFPNVQNGTELTGVYIPGQETRFYHDGKEVGRVRDPEFGKYFFGIWLDERTSVPKFRSQLVGQYAVN